MRMGLFAVGCALGIFLLAAGRAGPVVDVIKFSSRSGVQTITIDKIDNNNIDLPEILDPVIIDGTARLSGASITISSGASSIQIGGPNPGERNLIGVSVIEFGSTGTGHQIVGNYVGLKVNGIDLPGGNSITIGAADSTVRGNVMHSLSVGGSGTAIQGNLIGLTPEGATALEGATGLGVSGTGNTVGGTTTGVLNVTVQAGQGSISKIEFGAPRASEHGRVSVVGGPQNQTGAFTYTPGNSPTTAQVTVQFPDRSKATTVYMIVTDGCGAWNTFVGGGPGSF
jgi:hypothetical protein